MTTIGTHGKSIDIKVEGGDDVSDLQQESSTPETEDNRDVEKELTGQLQRLQAEFANYKRRTEKEWEGVFSRSKGDLVVKLLPVLDDFDRLLSHHQEDSHVDSDGVEMIVQKMQKILVDEGLEIINSVGKHFDPERHQAIAIEAVAQDQDEVVVEEWQKGYSFCERLLRPSQVKVGRYEAA
ncbi:nucleotide exchange factor GrpE [bacterium]|nr:nucleotide exchange factor GrpE [bacterium]